jgi:DNA polymerase-3 subunit gamma/tau
VERDVAAQVWYRKWRPQTFADVVGQRHVTETLARAVAQGRVAHAYLFCGPRGTGKTSTARILAKAVNCLNNVAGQPCDRCASCVAVREGRALDLVEMDAASNRGIDEIRALREKVGYAPSESRYKVYLIDEVHELTAHAFDALLKTLEEPPPHVIFVLATTEAHRVPETILSRCQRFDFNHIKLGDIVARLRQICAAEGVQASDGALQAIARRAGGALRDAVNLLEQVVAAQGPELDDEAVRLAIGVHSDTRAVELARLMLARDLRGALELVATIRDEAVGLRAFTAAAIEALRAALLIRAGAEASLDLAEGEREQLRGLARAAEVPELLRALRLLAAADFRADPQSPLPLELAIVEYITAPAAPTENAVRAPVATAAASTRTRPEEPRPRRPVERINALSATVQALDRLSPPMPPADGTAEPAQRIEAEAKAAVGAEPSIIAPEVPAPVDANAELDAAAEVEAEAVELEHSAKDASPTEAAEQMPSGAADGSEGALAAAAAEREDGGHVDLLETARKSFRAIYEACRARHRLAAGLLNSRCDIVEVADGLVTFALESEVLARRAGEAAYSRAIQEAVTEVLGEGYRVTFVVRPDVVSRLQALSAERPSHLLEEALKHGAKLVR